LIPKIALYPDTKPIINKNTPSSGKVLLKMDETRIPDIHDEKINVPPTPKHVKDDIPLKTAKNGWCRILFETELILQENKACEIPAARVSLPSDAI
jgi:hypothetical protein